MEQGNVDVFKEFFRELYENWTAFRKDKKPPDDLPGLEADSAESKGDL